MLIACTVLGFMERSKDNSAGTWRPAKVKSRIKVTMLMPAIKAYEGSTEVGIGNWLQRLFFYTGFIRVLRSFRQLRMVLPLLIVYPTLTNRR